MADQIILAGTGHRPDKLGGHRQDAFDVTRDALARAMELFEARWGKKPDRIISGMALGFDTALAQWAIENNVPLIAAIPFDGQHHHWPHASQVVYLDILKKAESSTVVSRGPYGPNVMQLRNMWMVDNATHIIALHNGSRGGTANCLRYAKAKIPKSHIVNFWPYWQTLAMERL